MVKVALVCNKPILLIYQQVAFDMQQNFVEFYPMDIYHSVKIIFSFKINLMRNLLLIIVSVCLSAGITFGQYGTGVIPDPVAAKKFPVKTPVSKGYGSELPSSFSLKAHTPYAKNQGNYGTCTSWAVAYGTMTTAYAYRVGFTNRNLITGLAFDPYFVYNQVKADPSCGSGSGVEYSLLLLMDVGAKKFYMPVIGCGTPITEEMKSDAANYRIADAYILYNTTDIMTSEKSETKLNEYFTSKPKPDIGAVKAALSIGSPVVFASYIPASFQTAAGSSWQPTADEKANPGKSVMDNSGMHQLHAMTIIGYDDNKNGGSFEILNSWGEAWGNNGFTWVKYEDWAMFTYQAFWIELGTIGLVDALLGTGCMTGDCTDGYGVFAFEDGSRYEGHFTAGAYDKYGIYTWASGEVYAGQFKNGMRNGEATRYLPTGEYGTCVYENDKLISGFADWKYNNGDTYYGTLSSGYVRNGYGEYKFVNGMKYAGSWKNDKREGLGKMIYANGESYIGEWYDDMPHGNGFLIRSNGKVDAGKWSYGKLEKGSTYGFASDEMMATMREFSMFEPAALAYASADCKTGDCLFGDGFREYKGGVTYTGEFKDGVEDGYGVMAYPDGSKVVGNWKQGGSNGVTRIEYADGYKIILDYANGQIDGYAMVMDGSGNVMLQYYSNNAFIRNVEASATPGASVGGKETFAKGPADNTMINQPKK